MNTENDLDIIVLTVMMALFFGTLCLISTLIKIRDFTRELNYIKREIERTTGREQQHWIKEKRRHWLSILPFYRR